MIVESRSIVFSDEELLAALQPILVAKKLATDRTPVSIECHLDESDDVTVTFNYEGDDPVTFTSREVGAAVINHCIEKSIPLPRGAYKELVTRGDQLALVLRIESGAAGPGDEDDGE